MADARTNVGKLGARRPQAMNNRSTSVLVAVLCAVLAGVLIYLFVSHYDKNSTPAVANVTVYEAKTAIPKGTPGATVAAMIVAKTVPSTEVQLGAITTPSTISSEVTSQLIPQDAQVTSSDFTSTNVTIASYLTGDQRAIAFPLDPAHGLTAYIAPESTVDIMGQTGGKTEVLAQNVTVLANANGDVVLRVTDKQALALASDSGVSTLWLTLRPVTGATESVRLGSTEGS